MSTPTPILLRRRAALAALFASLLALLLLAASASAAVGGHVPAGQFGSPGSADGQLSAPVGLAVDQSSGDVYVADSGNHRVDKFTASGAFLAAWGWGVSDGAAHSEVCTSGCQAGLPGPGLGQLVDPTGIAVDNSSSASAGDVYVADTASEVAPGLEGGGAVLKFTSAGEFLGYIHTQGLSIGGEPPGTFPDENFPRLPTVGSGIAVDGAGDLWTIARNRVDEFTPTGSYVPGSQFKAAEGFTAQSLSVNFAATRLYVSGPNEALSWDITPGHGTVIEENSFPVASEHGSGYRSAVDPATDALYLGTSVGAVQQYNASAVTIASPFGSLARSLGLAVNGASHDVYASDYEADTVSRFTPLTTPDLSVAEPTFTTPTDATLHATVDPLGAEPVSDCHFDVVPESQFHTSGYSGLTPSQQLPCAPDITGLSDSAEHAVHADLSALTTEGSYHYRLVVSSANGANIGTDHTFVPHAVVELATDPATAVAGHSATLNASFLGTGLDTHYYFEWGTDNSYGATVPLPPAADAGSAFGPAPLSVPLTGLRPITTYHYRVVAVNSLATSFGEDRSFTTTAAEPAITSSVGAVHTDAARLQAQISPGGADTTYRFEWGTDASYGNLTPVPDTDLGAGIVPVAVSAPLTGLTPNTTYHYRVLATNAQSPPGGTAGPDHTFHTFPAASKAPDSCPNALARAQTGAEGLLDCRAYELVSAANAGGYDVESDLTPGQEPFDASPEATEPPRVLYALHSGAIPGIAGNPTNHGPDPYVATHGENGWTTRYLGVPATDPFAVGPFSSTPSGTDASLDTLAFGAPGGCSPCFSDGKTGIPVRLPNGELVQGMAGSLDPGPAAEANLLVQKRLSADGKHLIFGSTSQFEPDASAGQPTIYDRDLATDTTKVISKLPNGAGNIPCVADCAGNDGLAELDISPDGSRIVMGQLISTDAAGNHYWHLYMALGDSGETVDLTPGTTTGALYDGMTSDGSKVFFTTKDQMTADDSDHSADIYGAEVSGQSATLTRVSTGIDGTGDTDACEPDSGWNAVSGPADCGALAIAGGGGVAAGSGAVYFLSPELLDGPANGSAGEPNLYRASPGAAPRFIATIDSSHGGPAPLPPHPYLHSLYFSDPSPQSVAVDQHTHDLYVIELDTDTVERFDSAGHPVPFTASGPYISANSLTGSPSQSFHFDGPRNASQVSVDNSGGPAQGDIYVTDTLDSVVDIFAPDGTYLGTLDGSATGNIGFGPPGNGVGPCGVTVDPTDGDLYIVDLNTNSNGTVGGEDFSLIWRYALVPGATAPYTDADYTVTGIKTYDFQKYNELEITNTCNVAAYGGRVYTSRILNGRQVDEYHASEFNTPDHMPQAPRRVLDPAGGAVAVDPADGDVYVDQGNLIAEFDHLGNPITSFGSGGYIGNSLGIAVDGSTGFTYASNTTLGNVAVFGLGKTPPPIDDPAVTDAVDASENRDTAAFQATPDGRDAVFTSTLPLTGYDSEEHSEVFRYDAPTEQLTCVSCSPVGAAPAGDAGLASHGSSLTDDGRVFFNTPDQLALADTDSSGDVYEWSDGALALVSAGTGTSDSSLLGVSADGTDAYFFTRDSLVSGDHNGPLVKIYDAREDGGDFLTPPAPPCAASDECHGAGSEAPAPPDVKSAAGSDDNEGPPAKHKQPPKKPHRKHHHRKSHHKRAGHNRGGSK